MLTENHTIAGELIETGTMSCFEYASYRVGGEVLHRIKAVGPIGIKERLPLYHVIARQSPSGALFAILDNHQRHENSLSIEDMDAIVAVLKAGGVNAFYGATVTRDPDYDKIGKLANAHIVLSGLVGRVIVTGDPEEAEIFMQEMLLARAAARGEQA
ncbi:hypothetical protein [Nisaea nitritireducens]|uniref:hypothetical protein n=1 Tax=Nisaea nitritireducens TaxID=568392 RepID=UPI001867DF0A|nr:hypothetical protein [Nisaea nitritireducens]